MGPTRKRHRKRKRRVLSDSDSDSDSSDLSDSSAPKEEPATVPRPASSSPSSTSDDDSDSDAIPASSSKPTRIEHPPPPNSPSPPPNVDIPPFIPPSAPESEQALKEKFRKFWMTCIADGFKDDLEQIRKEPNLGPSRLALLIESLASGADVFSSTSTDNRVNEMEVVLDQLP